MALLLDHRTPLRGNPKLRGYDRLGHCDPPGQSSFSLLKSQKCQCDDGETQSSLRTEQTENFSDLFWTSAGRLSLRGGSLEAEQLQICGESKIASRNSGTAFLFIGSPGTFLKRDTCIPESSRSCFRYSLRI